VSAPSTALVCLFVFLSVLVEQVKELGLSLGSGDSMVGLQVKLVEFGSLGSLLTQLTQSSTQQGSVSLDKVITHKVSSYKGRDGQRVTGEAVPRSGSGLADKIELNSSGDSTQECTKDETGGCRHGILDSVV